MNIMDATELEHQIDRQEKALERLLSWIGAVDSKVPLVVGFDMAMLAAIAALAPDKKELLGHGIAWLLLGGICFVVSLVDCALATFPRTAGPTSSLIFFAGIAGRPYPNYLDDVKRRTAEEYFNDLTMQCHRNAEIACQKFQHLKRATAWLFAGVLPWLLAIYNFLAMSHVAKG